MSDRLKDLLASLVIILVFIASRIGVIPGDVFFRFAALFALIFHAQILGRRLLRTGGWASQTSYGALVFLAIQSLAQTAWFYSGRPLGTTSDLWTMTAAMVIADLIALIGSSEPHQDKATTWDLRKGLLATLLAGAGIAALAFVLLGAFRGSTAVSIRTPWPLLLPGTLTAIALIWITSALTGWLTRSAALAATLAGVGIGATTAIAPLLYRIGYGFDGFLHIASERIIMATGTLSPRPLYYIGQYVFTTWFARNAGLPIEAVDRWLVPIAAAFLIPFALYVARRESETALLPFILFLVPLAPFVATTPQALAYLLGLAALLLCRGLHTDRVSALGPFILAAWSAAIHPLAGVPFLFIVFALWSATEWQNTAVRRIMRGFAIAAAVGAAAAVPALFAILSRSGTDIRWDPALLFHPDPWLSLAGQLIPWLGNVFAVWPGWASLALRATPAILIIALIVAIRQSRGVDRWRASLLLGAAGGLLLSSAALKSAGDFAFLIDYERGNYADRLILLAILCLIPFTIDPIARLLEKARTRPLITIALLATCGAFAAGQSYAALPRYDAVEAGHGWSVGQADIDAVRAIDHDAGTRPYTVLADQSVSAAAVSQFGFKRYNGDIFFYPIPTGGRLYDTFLAMTYNEPSRDTAKDAARLGGTDLVYVVLNDYWWNAEQLADELSAIADKTLPIGDATQGLGRSATVYVFDVSTSSSRATHPSGS